MTGRIEWNTVTIAPRQRTFQHHFHLRDVLHEDTVRDGGGHRDAQLRRYVRGDGEIRGGREVTDGERVGDPANTCDVGLQNVEGLTPDGVVKRRRAVQTLAASPRRGDVLSEALEAGKVGRFEGL